MKPACPKMFAVVALVTFVGAVWIPAVYAHAGKVHNGKNNGTVTTKWTGFFVAEKGKPLSAPAK